MESFVLRGDNDMNCHLLVEGSDCYVVDPGFERDRLRREISSRGLRVVGTLLTHAHMDHFGAADAFDAPVFLHEADVALLCDPEGNGFAFFGLPMPFDPRSLKLRFVAEGDALPLGAESIRVMHAPGHTPGGVCYAFRGELCSGDTLFRQAVGRWDFPGGDEEALRASVLRLIDTLPPETKVYPGHGPATTIAYERSRNPFYAQWRARR
jgi:glyoxylase-like metal-dependent hydrolase (beta-lactamase superfamily II)